MTKLLGRKPGFTLIESLSVIAIIGILLSLSAYLITQAQRQARDAVRKSDVSTIAQGFEARYLDKTCLNQTELALYPGVELVPTTGRMPWTKAEALNGAAIDSCNPYSTYLSIIPKDPKSLQSTYYFNLSAQPGLFAKHYRIAARLEKEPNEDQWEEICRLSDVWYDDYLGERYDSCGGNSIGAVVEPEKGILASFLSIFGIAQARTVPCPAGQHEDPGSPGSCIPDTPQTEICGDGIDNDGDGQVDEGCGTSQTEICGNGIDDDGDGQIDEGCGGGGGGGGATTCEATEIEGPPPDDCPGGGLGDNLPYNYYIGR